MLARIPGRGSGLCLLFIPVIVHREPVRMRRSPNDSTGE
jgi:hypothetical protein